VLLRMHLARIQASERAAESTAAALRLCLWLSCWLRRTVRVRGADAPASAPMSTAPTGPTKPDAGVTVARPAMEPVQMPTRLALPVSITSCIIHTNAAVAAASCVARHANAAPWPAAAAEPPLKPNQPTQSMPA
jgi:hypothetical protein